MPNRSTHERLLELGFEQIRGGGGSHLIYRHSNGSQLTTPSTPSDYRSTANTLAQAARLAGVSNQGREAVQGQRRKKRRATPPAAIDPRGRGPEIPLQSTERNKAQSVSVPNGEVERRTVPVVIANMNPYRPRPVPRAPIAHIRAVDALPRGMRDRVLKLAAGDYTRIKILADNRVEIT